MEPDYVVPVSRSPYRWRIIIRIVIALVCGCYPLIFIIGEELSGYLQNIARGDTFEHYISLRPTLWSMLPLCFALGCLLIGIGRDSWLLVKRRGTATAIPILYWLTLLFAVIAFVLYMLTVRIP